jgi:hypothetical protein
MVESVWSKEAAASSLLTCDALKVCSHKLLPFLGVEAEYLQLLLQGVKALSRLDGL